ncbi:hypothetical protein PAEPH01_0121 [Pancytospora epiphaga]|nr:hypothetical protein PAEPH01_0121 [Pancytospora epiphaga]
MLNKLFASKEVLKHNLGYCKLYDTKYNHIVCTKMHFTTDQPAKYEFLRSIAHYNILPVYKITQHSIYTKHVVPFSEVYSKEHVKYNEYVVAKLRETIKYLNDDLKIEHRNIVMDALFVDNYGNVLIGKFDRTAEYKDGNEDKHLLNELSKTILGVELDEVGDGDFIFRTLEDREAFFKAEVEKKRNFIENVLESKDEILQRIINTIIHLLIDDISRSENEEYKIFVLDSLRKLDGELLTLFSKNLFSILDSPVRMYLLQQNSGLGNLNECVDEICLGLRVKEKTMKIATIDFIFKNEYIFNTVSFSSILRSMHEYIVDTESVSAICVRMVHLKRSDVYKPIYKLLTHFILLGKVRVLVFKCTEAFFSEFDKYKVSTELLPLLCSHLADPDSQDACFSLVEKILLFLKENRNELRAREWSIKNITGIFGSKKEKAYEPEIIRMSKKNEDSWEETDAQGQ